MAETNSRALAAFISRPMSGTSYVDDCQLILDIKKAAKEAGVRHFRVMNSWSGPQVPLRIMNPRLYRLGRAMSQMAEADLIIFIDECWEVAKGCAVELEAYERYKDVYSDQWTAYIYYPSTKTLVKYKEAEKSDA